MQTILVGGEQLRDKYKIRRNIHFFKKYFCNEKVNAQLWQQSPFWYNCATKQKVSRGLRWELTWAKAERFKRSASGQVLVSNALRRRRRRRNGAPDGSFTCRGGGRAASGPPRPAARPQPRQGLFTFHGKQTSIEPPCKSFSTPILLYR